MNDSPIKTVAVRVMCFNEQDSIVEVVERTLAAAATRPYRLSVEVIDDGSADESSSRLARRFGSDGRVSVHRHELNLGIGTVLRHAFRPTDEDAVVLLCGDLQFAPEDVPRLVDELPGCGMVIARRRQRRDRVSRRILTHVDRVLTTALFGVTFADVHWVRAVRGTHLQRCKFMTSSPMVDLELALHVTREGGHVRSVDLPHYPRTRGKASGARVSLVARSFFDLLRVAAAHRLRGVPAVVS